MRIEKDALISANIKLREQLEKAKEALQFYAAQKHYDTVRRGGDPPGVKRTRLLDNGAVAEEALRRLEGWG